jgi:hypothetical protein
MTAREETQVFRAALILAALVAAASPALAGGISVVAGRPHIITHVVTTPPTMARPHRPLGAISVVSWAKYKSLAIK